jgi:hypothetical protein
MIVLLLYSLLVLATTGLSIQNGGTPISPDTLRKVQTAIATTNDSQTNIAKAYLACEQWTNILSLELPPNIRALCLAFQTVSLTRVGRDLESLDSYSACLDLKSYLDDKTLQDVQLGQAYALQRLLRYDQARQHFLACAASETATIGAATCALRLSDVERAIEYLTAYCDQHGTASDANGLLDCLLFLQRENRSSAIDTLKMDSTSSALYAWLHFLETNEVPAFTSFDFLKFAAVNQCALDDPALLQLDDKVHLHELLSSTKSLNLSFWPKGYIMPRELTTFQSRQGDGQSMTWILKERAGYGSHGNRIMCGMDIVSRSYDDEVLCQSIVHPSLLLDGRKFSMRVYLYYFLDEHATPSVYLSSLGLVKFASIPFNEEESSDPRMHMTNSGREDAMDQRDFVYLQSVFKDHGWSYAVFWGAIRQSIETLMDVYTDSTRQCSNNVFRLQLHKLGIPKIMGLDFLVDHERRPQLIEVNRFPGLEPRGDGDGEVKQRVVLEAWRCAATRLGVDAANVGLGRPESPPSFEKIR